MNHFYHFITQYAEFGIERGKSYTLMINMNKSNWWCIEKRCLISINLCVSVSSDNILSRHPVVSFWHFVCALAALWYINITDDSIEKKSVEFDVDIRSKFKTDTNTYAPSNYAHTHPIDVAAPPSISSPKLLLKQMLL